MTGFGDFGAMGLQLVLLFSRAALVIGCAWILSRSFSSASAAVRHGLWAAGLFTALCLPPLQLLLPPLPVPLPAAFKLSSGPTPSPTVLHQATPAASVGDGRTASASSADAAVTAHGPEPMAGPLSSIPWAPLALGLWLFGVASRLGWIAAQGIVMRRILAGAHEADDRSRLIAADAAASLGIRRTVRVILTRDVSMPITWGLRRSVIALPVEVVGWPEQRLRVALLHEMAHVRRRDYLTSMTAEVACAVYWPLPLVWLARERLRAEQELGCDDRVLLAGIPSLDYAQHLLAVARDFYGRKTPVGIAIAMAREVRLKDRVRAILDESVDRRPLRAGGGLPGLFVVAILGVPLAAVQGGGASLSRSIPTEVETRTTIGDSVRAVFPPPTPLGADVERAMLSYWFEAEDFSLSGAAEMREDLDASGAAFVAMRPGEVTRASKVSGTISSPLLIEREIEAVVWVRLIGDGGEKLHLWIDDHDVLTWMPETAERRNDRDWRWVVASSIDSSGVRMPLRLRIAEGGHVLSIRGEGDPVQIDRVLVTSDLEFTPAGHGPPGADHVPSSILVEAESALRSGRLRDDFDRDASGGEYLVFRSAEGSTHDGVAIYTLEVERPGRYLVWGRVLPRDDDQNSVFVAIDGGPERVWDLPSRANRDDDDWRWDPLNARDVNGRTVDPLILDLSAGSHELRLRTRESGARVDALLVTNELSERPRRILASLASDPGRSRAD